MTAPRATLAYRRARFSTRLPVDRRYTGGHYWLLEDEAGVWRVGFTGFAIRMLGELVDLEFPIAAGATVGLGDEIGTVEGFKAVTAVFSVADGEFLGVNDELSADITAVESSPYERGWLYRVRGRPDPDSLDVHGYAALLDATVDRLLASRHDAGDEG